MKIVLITGSPHRRGASDLLAEKFTEGAREAGHEVVRFDAAFANVSPCRACLRCTQEGRCVQDDDMQALYPHLKEADVYVFCTPVYYHAPTAQLLTVVDRFFAAGNEMREGNRKAVLMVTGGNPDISFFDGIVSWFRTDIRFQGWENAGELIACGTRTRELLEGTEYPEMAYELGKNLQ